MKKYIFIIILFVPGCNIIGTEGYRLEKIFTEAEHDKIHFMSDHIDLKDVEVCVLLPYADKAYGEGEKIKEINRAIKEINLSAYEWEWYVILWREDYFKYYRMRFKYSQTENDSSLRIIQTGFDRKNHRTLNRVFSDLNFTPSSCANIKDSAFVRYETKHISNRGVSYIKYITFGVTNQ